MHNLYILQSSLYLPIVLGILAIAGLSYVRKSGKGVLYFAFLSMSVAAWLSLQGLAQLNINSILNLYFIKLTGAISLFIGYFFVLFIRDYVGKKNNRSWLIITLIPCLLLFIANITKFGITSVTINSSGIITNDAGIWYMVGVVLVGLYFLYGLVLLIINTFKIPKNERITNYLIIFAFLQLVVINLIAAFFFTQSASAQIVTPISILLFISIIGYAIIKHKLFDIKFIAVRALTYLLSVGVIAIVYGLLAFRLFDILLPSISRSLEQTIDISLAILMAFTFTPLIRYFSKITNRIFYRDKYDAQELVNNVGKILASDIDLDSVSQKVVKEITDKMKIEKGEIVVFGEKQLFYENNVFVNESSQITQNELRKLGRTLLVIDEVVGGERKELMQRYDISISIALHTSEQFIGYLLLSQKKSGDIFNAEDINVLRTLGTEISVAIQNALSYKEIQLFSETLAQKVRDRTAQLRNANDQLRILDQAKDEFISMASHQLRTPLTTVKGYASMLEEGDFGKLTKEQREKVDLTLDGANRMARLIDDLLNVSRMDANRFFLEITEVDMACLVDQELQQLKSLAESKKVKIDYSPPTKKIPNIRLDENKTRQVVMNLVDNAIHYSQPPMGGGQANVDLKLDNDRVVFTVKDNGIGVPAAVQKKLFTKMFRANNAKATRPDGTGLGLYLVKRVVQDQGGEIIFESTEGKGSTFGFSIPLSGVPKSIEEKSRKIGAKVAATQKSG